MENLKKLDPQVYEAMEQELWRQRNKIELIASENFVSEAVLEAQGSVLTNKYAEGYPKKRYYGGCEYVDIVEELAITRAKELFDAEHANVQPHSGASANLAVYFAVLKPGDNVLGMDLSHGGHLTHGSPVNISGVYYNFHPYGVDEKSGRVNYKKVRELAQEIQPKMIVAGASAYPHSLDFSKFREIADEVGAYLMVDMAHIAGLVAVGLHQSPVPYADFVTTTTHKTLRGPRGGLILCKAQYKKMVNKAIFPGLQGGPLMHVIAAKAVALKEAMEPDFKGYVQQVTLNAKALAKALMDRGIKLVGDGTDTHKILLDLRNLGITGKDGEHILDEVGITVNKNTIPFDPESPFVTSGIRIGTPAVTTRGFKEQQMDELADIIANVLKSRQEQQPEEILNNCKKRVESLCKSFPLY